MRWLLCPLLQLPLQRARQFLCNGASGRCQPQIRLFGRFLACRDMVLGSFRSTLHLSQSCTVEHLLGHPPSAACARCFRLSSPRLLCDEACLLEDTMESECYVYMRRFVWWCCGGPKFYTELCALHNCGRRKSCCA